MLRLNLVAMASTRADPTKLNRSQAESAHNSMCERFKEFRQACKSVVNHGQRIPTMMTAKSEQKREIKIFGLEKESHFI